MNRQSLIDHYLPKLLQIARRNNYYGDGTPLTEPQLESFAQAAANASDDTPLHLAHYCEILQYSQAAIHYGHSTVQGYLIWLAAQPIVREHNSEFGNLPYRAQRILAAYEQLYPVGAQSQTTAANTTGKEN